MTMSSRPFTRPTAADLERWAGRYARVALGAAFLSGVAARFGLWGDRSNWKTFADFVRYTGEVNSFMPAAAIPFLAWAATALELGLGIALVLGIRPRVTALASAALLALFGTAMAISFGIKSPLDYSVFSASAAALLLALRHPPTIVAGRERSTLAPPTHTTQEIA
ncbi:MAG TPA: DoxX family membrane protein [Gemmatimonadaceae bacterium]